MADIPPGSTNALYTAIKHISRRAALQRWRYRQSAECGDRCMNALATDPATDALNALGLCAPNTGLLANWIIMNVAKSGAASGEATSIHARHRPAPKRAGRGNIVFFPQAGAGVGHTRTLHGRPVAAPSFAASAG